MYDLPKSTEIKKQLPKKAIFDKFNLKSSERKIIDANIKQIDIVADISSDTVPALEEGKEIKGFYVLNVQMKQKEYDGNSLVLLTKLIPKKLIFALQFEEQTQFVIYHTKLISSLWQPTSEAKLSLSGLNIDAVWDNMAKNIGQIEVKEGNTLSEQININEQQKRILAKISTLKKKMANEKQSHRKREYHKEIRELEKQIEELKN